MIVEVCANSLDSALIAARAGADRIELCAELAVGGITPSYGLIELLKSRLDIPIHVLIRPRSGDFTYTEQEFEVMKADIKTCGKLGIAGVVCGVLQKDYSLDLNRTSELIELSGEMAFTFHRAFDWVSQPLEAFAKLDAMGVDFLLSSGQQEDARQGEALLNQLNQQAKNCTVMPGGGINATKAEQFLKEGFRAIHLSGSELIPNLERLPSLSMMGLNALSEHQILRTEFNKIASVVRSVK